MNQPLSTASRPVDTAFNLEAILRGVPALCAAVAPGAASRDLERTLLFEQFSAVRAAGIQSLRVPVEYGGAGGSVRTLFEVLIDISAADSSLGHSLRSHFNFIEGRRLSGHSQANATHFARILNGAIYGGAHTETGTERPGQLKTLLSGQAGNLRLNGVKYYSTGTLYADYASVTALDEEGNAVGITLPVNRNGVTIIDDWRGMGQKLTASGTLRFEDVHVQDNEVSRERLAGLVGRYVASFRQLHLAACVAGINRRLLDDAVSFINNHSRSPAISKADKARDDEFIQFATGEIGANAYANRALILAGAESLDRASTAIENGDPQADSILLQATLDVAQAQLVSASLALRSANLIFDAGGGSATFTDFNLDRHWRNIRTILNHNPLQHKTRVVGDYYITGDVHHLTEGKSI